VAIVGVRFFGISRALLRYAERLASHDLAFRTLTDLRVRFFRRLVPLVPGGLPGIGSGDLLSRFVTDADRLQDLYLRGIGPPAIFLLAGAGGILAAYLILPAAALALAVVLVLGGVVVPLLTRSIARRAGARQAPARAALSGELTELAAGAPEIAVAGRALDWQRRSANSGARLGRLMRRDAVAEGFAVGLGEAVAGAAAVLMLVVAIPAVSEGELPGVLLAALVLLAMASIEAFSPLGSAAASLDGVAAAAARLDEVTTRPPAVAEPAAPVPVPRGGDLVAEGVRFSHEAGRRILDGVDLRLSPGTATALVGGSGIGKSTLADLLVRFADPSAGRICLAGKDLRDLDGEELREVVRLAPQDAYAFSTTLRANLALANPDAGEERMAAALAAVGLDDWVRSLPDGLDTYVGDSGARISGGQRQRIATARLLISEARVLIFDEPTTHLDPETGERVLEATCSAAHRDGRAVLVITHERTGLEGFDEVLELRSGRLRTAPSG